MLKIPEDYFIKNILNKKAATLIKNELIPGCVILVGHGTIQRYIFCNLHHASVQLVKLVTNAIGVTQDQALMI